MTTTQTRGHATNTRLEVGEDSIDRVTPKRLENGLWQITFTIRLQEAGKPLQRKATGRTKGEVRRAAKKKADALREQRKSIDGNWTSDDLVAEYIRKVGANKIATTKLAKSSRDRYATALRYLVGECEREDHEHRKSLVGLKISQAAKFRPNEQCLIEIAELHGPESGHHARTVLQKYVLDELIRDDLIAASPIAGKRIDLSGGNVYRPEGEELEEELPRALTREQWHACVDYLLTVDVAEGVEAPRRGMYTLEDRIAVRHNAIDLALLQAFTGLRMNEAAQVMWSMVTMADDRMEIHLVKKITKTQKTRSVVITEPAIIERFAARRKRARTLNQPVVGSPARPQSVWDKSQRTTAAAAIYLELAKKLHIEMLKKRRSHVWRSTINMLTKSEGVDESIRTTWFGHTPEVNKAHYSDAPDFTAIADVLTGLRGASGPATDGGHQA